MNENVSVLSQGMYTHAVRYSGKKIKIKNIKHHMPVYIFIFSSVMLTIVSFFSLDLDFSKAVSRMPKVVDVLYKLGNVSFENFAITVRTFTETVTVTILATIYGGFLGLLVGALAAKNITPCRPLSLFLKMMFSLIRAVPTPVWVLLILACLGFGMSAGIVGLVFHVVAFFGRTFAQSFEEVPDGSIEALEAVGANKFQIFFSAVLPSSFTSLIAWTTLRFEINFAEAAILGMVGAGGIGYTIMAAMNGYKYGRAGLAVVIIFLFSYGVEVLVTAIKRKVKI